MLEQSLTQPRNRLDYLGPIGAQAVEHGPVGQLLDTVDIWLAGTLQSLFNLVRR